MPESAMSVGNTQAILRMGLHNEIAMRALRGSAIGLVFLGLVARSEVIRFDGCPTGQAPSGWTIGMTHEGSAAQWQVIRDETAPSPPNVLAQTSQDRTAGRFPLAVWDSVSLRNGEVSVAFKAVSGA